MASATLGFCQNVTDLAHLVMFGCSTALFVALLAAYDNGAHAHSDTRSWFFAIVVGPPGCWLRWQLARLNGQVRRWTRVNRCRCLGLSVNF